MSRIHDEMNRPDCDLDVSTYPHNAGTEVTPVFDLIHTRPCRSDIEVKVSCRVINVTDRTLTIFDKWKKQKEELDYGVTVWATGIGTRPLVSDLMQKIGQTDRRALLTDEWLRVKGTQGIYAIGDCATVQQRNLVVRRDCCFGNWMVRPWVLSC